MNFRRLSSCGTIDIMSIDRSVLWTIFICEEQIKRLRVSPRIQFPNCFLYLEMVYIEYEYEIEKNKIYEIEKRKDTNRHL